MLGRGGYGQVWQAQSRRYLGRKFYAIKQISKVLNLRESAVRNLMNELKFMRRVKSDFVVKLHYALQDS